MDRQATRVMGRQVMDRRATRATARQVMDRRASDSDEGTNALSVPSAAVRLRAISLFSSG